MKKGRRKAKRTFATREGTVENSVLCWCIYTERLAVGHTIHRSSSRALFKPNLCVLPHLSLPHALPQRSNESEGTRREKVRVGRETSEESERAGRKK